MILFDALCFDVGRERICKTSNRREVISHINRTTDLLLALIELHCKIESQLKNIAFIV